MSAPAPAVAEHIDDFTAFGFRAFTTSREAGSFGLHTSDPVREVTARWDALRRYLASGGPRLATANQVHGARVVVHGSGWEGWLRADEADGHAAIDRGTAMAVSIADCVPVFLVHPGGAAALLHSGWRGTAARIVERGIEALVQRGIPAGELRLHLGPSVCGRCYEVSREVHAQLTGRDPGRPVTVDLRAIIAGHARAAGVRHISASALCTRCDNALLFSHRAGDAGRQIAVLMADM